MSFDIIERKLAIIDYIEDTEHLARDILFWSMPGSNQLHENMAKVEKDERQKHDIINAWIKEVGGLRAVLDDDVSGESRSLVLNEWLGVDEDNPGLHYWLERIPVGTSVILLNQQQALQEMRQGLIKQLIAEV